MTLVAHLLGNGGMNVIVQYPRLVGTVRVVTRGTAGFGDGIIHVLLHENRLVGFVASSAESDLVILEEKAGFR